MDCVMINKLRIVAVSLLLTTIAIAADAAAPEALRRRLIDKYKVREFVFAERAHNGRGKVSDGHWYANFGYYSRYPSRKAYSSGGSLRKLDLASGKSVALVEDKAGTFRDPAVHYDGKTIVFSYRKAGSGAFNLY